jgi:Ca-activated chloride channel family protein
VCGLDVTQDAAERPALKALFGARRVLGLEFLIHSSCTGDELAERLRRLGYDPEKVLTKRANEPSKVYAENERRDLEKALRGLLVGEALNYGLACSETAFVAVRTEVGKPVAGTVLVGNALPTGWSEGFLSGGGAHFQSLGIPQSATLGLVSRLRASRVHMQFESLSSSLMPTTVSGLSMRQPADLTQSTPLFSGVPKFTKGEAVLFDSCRAEDAKKLPDRVTLSRIALRFPGATLQPESLDHEVSLLVFVDDLASPRARVKLADLMRQRGERPLNLRKLPGQAVRIVLSDPAGVWAQNAPHIEVALGWQG